MKALCFKCCFVGIGMAEGTCPTCGYPLIVDRTSSGLTFGEIEPLMRRPASSPPLPGVSAEPRPAQIMAEKRRVRAARLQAEAAGAARQAAIRAARQAEAMQAAAMELLSRQRHVREIVAASAVVAVVLVTLGALM